MTIKNLAAAEIGFPSFDIGDGTDGDIFSFSSHQRARDALEFGLGIDNPHFNIFVLGEPRSGRLTSTVEFIETAGISHIARNPPPPIIKTTRNNNRKRVTRIINATQGSGV